MIFLEINSEKAEFKMNLTTIIITRNEENNIEACLSSVKFSKQIIVVDNNSYDRTTEIAKKHGAEIIKSKFNDFSKQREAGLSHVTSDWVLYVDADERVTKDLRNEIENVINEKSSKNVYRIKRRNFYLGKNEWAFRDELERLFRKDSIKGWIGEIHETPLYDGEVGLLNNFLDHYTHRDLTSMLNKTIEWSDTEAGKRYLANHPKMSWWRFPRVMIPVFFDYYFKQKGYKLGVAGLIESIFQTYSIFITYAKLWEMQNKST